MKSTTRLWTVQTLLAALFLFAGATKLIMPAEVMAAQAHLPGAFIKFIGICETLGALGLVLPGLTKIRTDLTALAASGLVVIMIGATVISAARGPVASAILPAVVGLLAIYVVRGRWPRQASPATVYRESLKRAA
jgi:hypothetical protein